MRRVMLSDRRSVVVDPRGRPVYATGMPKRKKMLDATLEAIAANLVNRVAPANREAAVDPDVVWAKMAAMAEGARIASAAFWKH